MTQRLPLRGSMEQILKYTFRMGQPGSLRQTEEDLVTRLANYRATGNIAAMVFPYGDGKVGAPGVHFEGRSNDIGYYNPEYPRQYGLGCSLLGNIMDYNGASSYVPTEPPTIHGTHRPASWLIP